MELFPLSHTPNGPIKRTVVRFVLGAMLLCAPCRVASAQTDVSLDQALPIRAWAFARLGGASGAPGLVATRGGGVLTSGSLGVAASRGMLFGMLKADDSSQLFAGPELRDWALLAGVRSRGDRVFVTGAAGVADVRPYENGDAGGGPVGSARAALAYDFSVHAAYRVVGLSLSIAGAYGPAKRSYVAALLGVEAGWFGR